MTDVRLMSLEELDNVIAEQQDFLQRTDGGQMQAVAEQKLEAALAERRTRL